VVWERPGLARLGRFRSAAASVEDVLVTLSRARAAGAWEK
jgi:hypothetical protein